MADNHTLSVKFLFSKTIDHYVIRDQNNEKYEKLEQSLQNTYNLADNSASMFEIGDYVAVYVKLDARRKLWVRAKVDNIYNAIAGFLYSVYLLDYGVKKCVQKSNIRALKTFLTHVFVPFRAIHFFLNDIKPTPDKHKTVKEVVKELQSDLRHLNTLELSAIIKTRDNYNDVFSYYGNIHFSNGSDLRSFLFDKGLAIDSGSDSIECIEVKQTVSKPIKTNDEGCVKIKPKINVIRQPIRLPFSKMANVSVVSVNGHNGDTVDSEKISSDSSSVASNVSLTNLRRKKLLDSLKSLNISKEDVNASSICSDDTNQSKSDSSSVCNGAKHEPEKEEPIEWPQFEPRTSYPMLKPAGCLPPVVNLDKYGKYYTLRS